MIMDILPPPGLENIVHSGALSSSIPSCASSEHTLDALPSWHLAQENAQLIWQNIEFRAQMAMINENAALARVNARLVEQLRRLGGKCRQPERCPKQAKASTHLDSPSDTASTCAASSCGYRSETDESDAEGKTEDRGRTTAMMRNIPSEYTRANLLQLLDQQGFLGSYDIVYLPVAIHTDLNHGYAFINFTTTKNFERFREHFTGFGDWMMPSDKICEVCWSDVAQGSHENIQKYRDSPMMHESIEDRFKPALFEHGRRKAFPEPTKRIRPPRSKKLFPAILDIPSDIGTISITGSCGHSSEADENDADGKTEVRGRTTAMMRNIPSAYTRANLLELLDQQGFVGSYDLVYLPIALHTELNYGYAFINFTTTKHLDRFREHFIGFSDWRMPSDRVCEVCWSDVAQGSQENIRKYRDSPMMHESVDDRFKPVLFEHGRRKAFPEPTKTIRAPRSKNLLPLNSD
jgi:hypothetical protein